MLKKKKDIYFPIVLEVVSLKWVSLGENPGCQQGSVPFWKLQGGIHFLRFPASGGCLHPLVHTPFLHLQRWQHQATSSVLCYLVLTLLPPFSLFKEALGLSWTDLDNPAQSPNFTLR